MRTPELYYLRCNFCTNEISRLPGDKCVYCDGKGYTTADDRNKHPDVFQKEIEACQGMKDVTEKLQKCGEVPSKFISEKTKKKLKKPSDTSTKPRVRKRSVTFVYEK